MIELGRIRRAAAAIEGTALRTPLVRLAVEAGSSEIYLKLENLQPIGSFKLRGALNAVAQASPGDLRRGVVTASAGNMAQGVAWAARAVDVPCTVVVPEHAPQTKLAAVERLGAKVLRVPFDRWWQAIEESRFDGAEGLFIHPVQDEAVMAGNGTIGLEVLDELPDVDAVLIPFGGGGLTVGIASALRAVQPDVIVQTVEPETAAPLAASIVAGRPCEIDYQASFVDGAGGRAVLPTMWPLVRGLIQGAMRVTLEETAAAVRLLVERNQVVAEGAGALAVAAALKGQLEARKVVCVVSGGNIDAAVLAEILKPGETRSEQGGNRVSPMDPLLG